ncbi:T9SS type B sorting domain-containing protein [Rudanella paleaurantiibacter]|uniref:T9SS type B sorting domain-containing protein n=1 Tax=Rudanella paleaurantiibacter TaxID=2614655 RepID=A0A7J5U4D2_9BACT|nr:T9SS type B sorting domain-containing protein [Rudanella paleaurantiibacter]KAB7732626.1 T9SS type B sorting domain-containing protein [Rudanella paleaurantiibacter]
MRCFVDYRGFAPGWVAFNRAVYGVAVSGRLLKVLGWAAIALGWFGGGISLAQNYCQPQPGVTAGGFTLNRTRVCANSNTNFSVTNTVAGAKNIQYIFGYNGNGLPTTGGVSDLTGTSTVTLPTSSTPGTYTILQIGSGGGTNAPLAKCETVTVLPNAPISFSAVSCSGRKATLSFALTNITSQYDAVRVDWGDGAVIDYYTTQAQNGPAIEHTYTSTNPVTIKVEGRYFNVSDCNALQSTFTVTPVDTPPAPPVVTNLTTVDANTIRMRVQGAANTPIQIWQRGAGGAFQPTNQTALSGQTVTIAANTAQSQCFQLRTASECPAPTSTEEYCSIVLNAQSGANRVDLTWAPYTATTSGSFRWSLNKDGFTLPIQGASNRNTSTYTDANGIVCGERYCYQVQAQIGNTTIVSNSICVTGSNGQPPQPMTDIRVSVETDGSVRYQALQPSVGATTNFTTIISRADSPSGPFNVVGQTTNDAIFIDKSAKTSSQAYCYRVVYRNACGQESDPSASACTIWLRSDSPGALDWTADSPFGPIPVVEYEVEIIDRITGNVLRRQPVGSNTHFEPDRSDPDLPLYRFVIVATATNGFSSRSNPYELNLEAGIFAPTAFTPNGDGINDRFQAKGFFTDNYRLTIFDRWGSVIYSTTSSDENDGWDGTLNGQPAPASTYVWRVEVTDGSGKKTVKSDSVLLIR